MKFFVITYRLKKVEEIQEYPIVCNCENEVKKAHIKIDKKCSRNVMISDFKILRQQI